MVQLICCYCPKVGVRLIYIFFLGTKALRKAPELNSKVGVRLILEVLRSAET